MNNIIKHLDKITLVLIILILVLFQINIDQWESYWYASSLAGKFNQTDIHKLYGLSISSYLDFNIFHPNHFLVHLLSWLVGKVFVQAEVLDIIRSVNLVFSVTGLIYANVLLKEINYSAIRRSIGMLLLFTTNLYWFYSLSGEVYIAPAALLIVTFYYLYLYCNNSENSKLIYFVCVSFCLSVMAHMIASLFIFTIIFGTVVSRSSDKRRRDLLVLFGLGFIIASFTYGVLFINFINVKSLKDYLDSLFVLSSVSGADQEIQSNFLLHYAEQTIWKLKSFFHSLIRNSTYITFVYKILLSVLFIYSLYLIRKFKERSYEIRLALVWLFSYFLFLTYYVEVPTNDYWMFLLYPFCLVVLYAFGKCKKNLFVSSGIVALVIVQFIFNFKYDILPKSKASLNEYSILAQSNINIDKSDEVLFVFNYENERYFNEVWYLNYFLNRKIKLFTYDQLEEYFLKRNYSFKNNLTIIMSPSFLEEWYKSNLHDGLTTQKLSSNDLGEIVLLNTYTNFTNNGYKYDGTLLSREESFVYEKLAQYPEWYSTVKSTRFNLAVLKFKR